VSLLTTGVIKLFLRAARRGETGQVNQVARSVPSDSLVHNKSGFFVALKIRFVESRRVLKLIPRNQDSQLTAERQMRHQRKRVHALDHYDDVVLLQSILDKQRFGVGLRAAQLDELDFFLRRRFLAGRILGYRGRYKNKVAFQAQARFAFELSGADWAEHQHRRGMLA
jgi:hypothetical protein